MVVCGDCGDWGGGGSGDHREWREVFEVGPNAYLRFERMAIGKWTREEETYKVRAMEWEVREHGAWWPDHQGAFHSFWYARCRIFLLNKRVTKSSPFVSTAAPLTSSSGVV